MPAGAPEEFATASAGELDLGAWRDALRRDMSRELDDPRWPRALIGVGTVHLAASIVSHVLAEPVGRQDLRYLVIWFVELACVLAALRLLAGRDWLRRSAAMALVMKLWTTFLIISFNIVTLNSLIDIEQTWFKPVWASLSTFLFASLAWLFTPLLFIPAVQMWATGMLMVEFPDHAYLTYGVSWWMALAGVAVTIRRNRARAA